MPKSKNGKNWGFSPPDRDEVWQVKVHCGSALVHQIWPSSVKGGRFRSPQMSQFAPKLWFLATGSRHNEHIRSVRNTLLMQALRSVTAIDQWRRRL